MSREVDALFAFGDAVEEAGIATRFGGTIIFWHEGREYLLDCHVFDVTDVQE